MYIKKTSSTDKLKKRHWNREEMAGEKAQELITLSDRFSSKFSSHITMQTSKKSADIGLISWALGNTPPESPSLFMAGEKKYYFNLQFFVILWKILICCAAGSR